MQDDRYFRLQSFYQAAFLFAKGMELANVDRVSNSQRATFVFVDSPEREDLMQSFSYGKEDDPATLVDARKLITAIRTLKEKLYQDKF
jgi:hypothetical protein